MRWLSVILFLFLGCESTTLKSDSPGLLINEIMVRNSSETAIVAPNGKSSDWIELYNMSDKPLNLSDYFLSDDQDNLLKANLPTVVLEPGAFITLWCGGSGNEGDLFLGFKLSSSQKADECVLLSHRSKGLVDSCFYMQSESALKKGDSFGRLPDGGIGWYKQEYPSPTAPNNG